MHSCTLIHVIQLTCKYLQKYFDLRSKLLSLTHTKQVSRIKLCFAMFLNLLSLPYVTEAFNNNFKLFLGFGRTVPRKNSVTSPFGITWLVLTGKHDQFTVAFVQLLFCYVFCAGNE